MLVALSVLLLATVNVLAAALLAARVRRLRRRLHDLAQAPHAPEHRDRRRRRRGAAAGRLGGRAGHCRWTAVLLFAIVFYWTPPHFWALSLLMKDEYAKVGVPMMPVARGERRDARQILIYSILLYAVTQLPFCAGGFGVIYLRRSMVLGLGFVDGAVRLYRRADRRSALRLYLFSLAYLALLFAAMVVDQATCRIRAVDRRLARKNVRTGLMLRGVLAVHVRPHVRRRRDLPLVSDERSSRRPARRRADPRARAVAAAVLLPSASRSR